MIRLRHRAPELSDVYPLSHVAPCGDAVATPRADLVAAYEAAAAEREAWLSLVVQAVAEWGPR